MKKIPLTGGGFTAVDDDDFITFSSKSFNRSQEGYARTSYSLSGMRKFVTLHRLIMWAAPGQVIDHIDGDRLNNQRSNLRFVSYAENSRNMRSANMKRGLFKGVYPRRSLWRASISDRTRAGSRHFHLGYFKHPEEAALAYDDMARRLYGRFALCNYPDES